MYIQSALKHEWSESKRIANLSRHGVDFAAIEACEWHTAVERLDNRHREPRFVAAGYIGDRLHVVVFTERGDHLCVISLRKATAKERKRYAEAQAH